MEELEVAGDEMVSLTHAERKADDTTCFVVVAAIMSALGGILFGYDIGNYNSAQLLYHRAHNAGILMHNTEHEQSK